PDLDFEMIWRTWGKITGMMGGYFIPNSIRSVSKVIFRRLVKNVPMLHDLVMPVSLKAYMRALALQDGVINRFELFMKDYDAFLCPVTLTPPFRHQEPDLRLIVFNIYRKPVRYQGKEYNYYMNTQSQTTPFNLMETPVLSMPLGINSQGLPVGIQVVGKRFTDFQLLKTAKLLAQYTSRFSYPCEKK
ncbi:MAG: amidase family protein, partial [Syntrophothermus sp.]